MDTRSVFYLAEAQCQTDAHTRAYSKSVMYKSIRYSENTEI